MPILVYVTAVAAFGGLLLGLWAAWRTFLDDRVKLRVTTRVKKVDNSWVVDGEIYEFVAVSVTNMSKFPIALASVDLVLEEGADRALSGVFDAIEPRRRKALSYPLLEKNRPDQMGDVASENVRSCRVRTECGLEIVKLVRRM
ncbi:MAG: hypothetical protein F4020_05645 [Gammaproteobacteria bacterium]|nr:hypothetical protein [Gammaproteobacteria bacterium]